jgi:hypothetical protein
LHIHPFYPAFFNSIIAAWKQKDPKWIFSLTGKEKQKFQKLFFENYPELPDSLKKPVSKNKQIVFSASFNDFGALEIVATEPLTDDKFEILHRFGKVFNTSYTRFNDLQKAEAQAREAQIEAALERVRSRSVAMRKSEEIADIAGKIFSELRQLDLALNRVLIWTFNEIEKNTTWWSSNPEVESTAESYRIDYNENPVFINYLQAWQQRKPVHLYTLSGDNKKNWEDYLFEHTEMSRLPAAVRKGMRQEGTLFTISVISDYGIMMSGSFEPLSDANIEIVQRFGRVFQQSYTRYLDVQKAEAQAREAEIQLALERIRSRAMAMQNSGELHEVVTLLFQQYDHLGLKPVVSILNLFDMENRTFTHYSTGKGGKRNLAKQIVPIDASDLWSQVFIDWERDKAQSVTCPYYPKESLEHIWSLFPDIRSALPAEDTPQLEDYPNGMFQTTANCRF